MAPLVWLITGCSSGFGLLLAQQALLRGDCVIATARDVKRISHLDKIGAQLLSLDVTSDQVVVDDILRQGIAIYGAIDVLVNNAGYIQAGAWEDVTAQQLVSQFETNVFGPVKVAKAILPHFRSRRQGTLVFIGSLSGWVGHPFCGAYAASKFALEGLVEALRLEVEPFGINTLLVEPGRFRTSFLSPSSLQFESSTIPDYYEASRSCALAIRNENGHQPGNPISLTNVVLDAVHGQFSKDNTKKLFRLPLGSDCFEEIQDKCKTTLALLQEQENLIRSTNYEDAAENESTAMSTPI